MGIFKFVEDARFIVFVPQKKRGYKIMFHYFGLIVAGVNDESQTR